MRIFIAILIVIAALVAVPSIWMTFGWLAGVLAFAGFALVFFGAIAPIPVINWLGIGLIAAAIFGGWLYTSQFGQPSTAKQLNTWRITLGLPAAEQPAGLTTEQERIAELEAENASLRAQQDDPAPADQDDASPEDASQNSAVTTSTTQIDHQTYKGFPLNGLTFEACVWSGDTCVRSGAENFDWVWTPDGRLWETNLPSKEILVQMETAGTLQPFEASIKLPAGNFSWSGVECQLYLDESRAEDGGRLVYNGGNAKEFTVNPAPLRDGETGEELPVAYGKIKCNANASTGADIWFLGQ